MCQPGHRAPINQGGSIWLALGILSAPASAESSLDNIIAAKKLRCGVQLDYPPAGYRDKDNKPEGYDVAYCKDMAAALGVEAEIVETPSPERIPALVSNRIDVLIASASITTKRALTVSFSQPYVSYTNVVLTRSDTGIENFDNLKGRAIGGVTGTTTEADLTSAFKKWNDPKGMTMIVVTHDIAFARETGDRVAFFDAGLICEIGKANQVINEPREERTRQFLQRVLH